MNDKQIREILVAYLKSQNSEMRIFHEKNIGGSTCDLMMVTPDAITGFEIKSDLDNYQRLDSQVRHYNQFFQYKYIVVGKSHSKTIKTRVPSSWGILVIDNDLIEVKRKAEYICTSIQVSSQLSILWKMELKNLLNYFRLPMYAQKNKDFIISKLMEFVPLGQLEGQISFELLNRDYSVYGAEDYTEQFKQQNKAEDVDLITELADSASEMDLDQMTLAQWINIYTKAKEIKKKKDNIDERILRKKEPHSIKYTDIEVSPGAPWIDKSIMQDFIQHISGDENCVCCINYEPVTGNWYIERKNYGDRYTPLVTTYGLRDYNALHILECLMNLREIKRFDRYNNYDEKSTIAAIEKQAVILREFKKWVWEDEDRIWLIEEAYNKLFDGIKKERYDGSKLEFEGLSSDINLFDYQKDAVQRIVKEKNTLLAFDVGAGKTYIMIAAAMYMRQQGMSRKNMFVVPNNIVGQWEKLFTDLYPLAKLLVVEPKSFKQPVREKTIQKMREGDYDGIIIAYSCFDMIPLSAKVIAEQMKTKLDEIDRAIQDMKYGYETGSRSALEKKRDSIIKLTKEFTASMDYKSAGITFDELEINTLFVDEAHNYKNLRIDTHLKNLRGINTKGSEKCQGLLSKIRCVQSQNQGRGVVFATGTPICNSLSDAYTMQIYLQYDELKKGRLDIFDNWVKTFARPEQVAEIDVSTKNYRMVTRFARFFNLPELSLLFSQIAAFYAVDENAELPDFNGYNDCVIEKNKVLSKYMNLLADRTEAIRKKKIDKSKDNMLKVSTDGRKAALDLRLVDKNQPVEFSKVERCANNVVDIYNSYEGCSQLVFCDYSTPKGEAFSVYKELKEKLIGKGIKPKEIAFIHSYHTEERKVELFEKVNAGIVRVLIGSTFKLGIGANVQTVLKAIHHLDVPWRPADMVQREGRILRRGNTNSDILIYRYICEGSFDAYSWQILETKQRFISQFLMGSAYQRSAEDLENNVLTYAEVKALALCNEKMKILAEKENELAGVRIMSIKHIESMNSFKEDIKKLNDSISSITTQINGVQDKLMEITSKTENDYKQLRKVLTEMLDKFESASLNCLLGTVWGFDIYTPDYQTKKPTVLLKHNDAVFFVEMGDSLSGNAQRISNFIQKLDSYVESLAKSRGEYRARMQLLEKELTRENPYNERIRKLEAELRKIRKSMDIVSDDKKVKIA